MNFATIPNVPLFLKGCGKGEAFYDAPVNLGLQPIKLLALEPFEIEHQGRSNSIEKQICVFSGGNILAHIGSFDVHIQNLVAAVCPYFIGREPGSPILAACKVLAEIASVGAVHLRPLPEASRCMRKAENIGVLPGQIGQTQFQQYSCFSLRISLCGFTMFSSMDSQMYSST